MEASGWRPSVRGAFAAATVARGLSWCLADMFLGYHLHARAGLSSAETGAILLILLLAGALADLAAGLLLKRQRSLRKAVFAMQRVGAIGVAVALVPLFLPGVGLVGALIWGGAFRIAFSFYAIPQTTLLSILPANPKEQKLYVTLHAALGASARLLTASTAFLIVDSTSLLLSAVHIGWVMVLAASGIATSFLLEYAVPAHGEPEIPRSERVAGGGWPQELNWLLASTAFHAGALYMMSRLFLFAPPSDGLQAVGPWTLIAWTVGLTIGPCLPRKSDRASFPVAVAAAASASSLLLISSIPFPAKLVFAAIYGAGLSTSGAQLLGAIAYLVREGSGASAGMAFAAFALITKVAMAAGNGSLAFLLDGYAADAQATTITLATINLGGGILCVLAWRNASRTGTTPLVKPKRKTGNRAEDRPRRSRRTGDHASIH